ncbi:MAG: lipoyl synthase [Halanaerobiales bacterium]
MVNRKRKRLPSWLRKKYKTNQEIKETKNILNELGLNTVCQSAKCPNIGECFSARVATFMIMGNSCSRSCRFCAVPSGPTEPLNPEEPKNIARAVRKMELAHVVITSVTRDDLDDGGAGHFAATVKEVRKLNPECVVEVLTPDFEKKKSALDKITAIKPDIFNHNVETVPALYDRVRPEANYERSLAVLKYIKDNSENVYIKSGLMVGLGESESEIIEVMEDLREIGCDILTIGQYLQPTKEHLPVDEYIPPAKFEEYKELGEELGFRYVASGPLVRSSFHASDFSEKHMKN